MKIKKIIFVFIGIVIGVICFIAGWEVKNVQCEDELYDYALQIDSLECLEELRQDEQLPYYGMMQISEIPPQPFRCYPPTF